MIRLASIAVVVVLTLSTACTRGHSVSGGDSEQHFLRIEVRWLEADPERIDARKMPESARALLDTVPGRGSWCRSQGLRSRAGGRTGYIDTGLFSIADTDIPHCLLNEVECGAFLRAIREDEASVECTSIPRQCSFGKSVAIQVHRDTIFLDPNEPLLDSGRAISGSLPELLVKGFDLLVRPRHTAAPGGVHLDVRIESQDYGHREHQSQRLFFQASTTDGMWLLVGGIEPCGSQTVRPSLMIGALIRPVSGLDPNHSPTSGRGRCHVPVAVRTASSGRRLCFALIRVCQSRLPP